MAGPPADPRRKRFAVRRKGTPASALYSRITALLCDRPPSSSRLFLSPLAWVRVRAALAPAVRLQRDEMRVGESTSRHVFARHEAQNIELIEKVIK